MLQLLYCLLCINGQNSFPTLMNTNRLISCANLDSTGLHTVIVK